MCHYRVLIEESKESTQCVHRECRQVPAHLPPHLPRPMSCWPHVIHNDLRRCSHEHNDVGPFSLSDLRQCSHDHNYLRRCSHEGNLSPRCDHESISEDHDGSFANALMTRNSESQTVHHFLTSQTQNRRQYITF